MSVKCFICSIWIANMLMRLRVASSLLICMSLRVTCKTGWRHCLFTAVGVIDFVWGKFQNFCSYVLIISKEMLKSCDISFIVWCKLFIFVITEIFQSFSVWFFLQNGELCFKNCFMEPKLSCSALLHTVSCRETTAICLMLLVFVMIYLGILTYGLAYSVN